MSARVLVIESEPWLGEHFQRVLEHDDFTVSYMSNAYAAIDAINQHTPDVIIMSLLLSGAGGLTLLHELQSYTDTATVPIIVCSDHTVTVPLEELEPYGVVKLLDTHTMKPADIPAAVRSVLA